MKMQVTLVLKKLPSLPVEAESINPENVTAKGIKDIENLTLWSGNRQEKVGDYFKVSITPLNETGKAGDSALASIAPGREAQDGLAKLVVQGDLSRFKRLGQGMTAGEMEIRGSVGFHAGALMRGGKLLIQGDAGDWLGAHMEGGQIRVEGSAGHFVGAAYRGETQGMTGGTILIRERAGQMVGARMRRGVIAIGGDCGDLPGFGMLAGTILIAGTPGRQVGAKMQRGTVIILQPNDLLPTFYYNCTYEPPFWGLLYAHLAHEGFELSSSYQDVLFKRYSGDANEGGRGEILTCLCH